MHGRMYLCMYLSTSKHSHMLTRPTNITCGISLFTKFLSPAIHELDWLNEFAELPTLQLPHTLPSECKGPHPEKS